MKLLLRSALILTLVCTATAADLSDQAWYEVTTPHFVIISNAGEKNARDVARQLEAFRAVFERGFPSFRISAAAPTIVVATKDEGGMRQLAPWFWEHGIHGVVGAFFPGWETNYALLRLDEGDPYQTVFHEYVHQIQKLNFTALPAWLREGLAEYYSTAEISPTEVKLGLPSSWLRLLRETSPIPVQKLLTEKNALAHGDWQSQMFYAESWALTHMLISGPGMDNGAKMDDFLNRLELHGDQLAAFQQVFGDPHHVGQQLRDYIQQHEFPALRMRNPPQVEASQIIARPMKRDEVAAELAGFEMAVRRSNEAQRWLDVALRDKPGPATAHRLLGFQYFHDGKDEQALSEFSTAFAQDPKDYLSAYYAAMLKCQQAKDVTKAEAELQQALKQVRTLNPSFAPVHIELARTYLAQKQLDVALPAAEYAAQLEPGRAGYHLFVARILLQQGKAGDAAKIARYVAERWESTDRDQAIDILKQAINTRPTSGAATPDADKLELTSDVAIPNSVVSGVIKSSTCPSSGRLKLTLQVSDHTEEFTYGKNSTIQVGFEDTLWYGEHFELCHHLDGQRAVIHYKPDTPKDAPKELLRIRVCDETGSIKPQP